MQATNNEPQGPEQHSPDLEATPPPKKRRLSLSTRLEKSAGSNFLMPAVIIILVLAIFPLVISLALSFSRLKFVKGGFDINFVGLDNYKKLLVGTQQTHFLGAMGEPTLFGWIVFWGATAACRPMSAAAAVSSRWLCCVQT